MSLKKYVVISGMSGVYKMLGNRSNGLIVEGIEDGKRQFVSARKHQFTPLDSISIYTKDGGTSPLDEVFNTMKTKLDEIPLPANKMTSNEAFDYLGKILPNYDEEQVHVGDVKKLVKWFSFLHDKDLIGVEEETTEEEETEKE